MKNKRHKIGNIFPKPGSNLLGLLCLLFCIFPSAQIYIEKTTQFFVTDRTLITIALPAKQENKASVYIVKGTIVSNMHETEYVKIAYIQNKHLKQTENQFVERTKNKKKLSVIANKKTKHHCLLSIKVNNRNKTFLNYFQNLTLAIIIVSNKNKNIPILEEQKFTYQKAFAYRQKQAILCDKILFSFDNYLSNNTVRPPPFI